MEPFVALSAEVEAEAGRHRKPRVGVYEAYVRVLARVGLTPVLVTAAHPPEQVRALLDACAGLVLTGGDDIAPHRFDEAPIPALGPVSEARDAMEWRALDVALERGMPVLGICRGIQVIDVYFGGTLYQDLDAQREPGPVQHRQPGGWSERQHEVRLTPGTRLHSILGGCEPLRVNSYHHQAIRDVPPALRVSAVADDGLVEGLEHPDHPWVVGVQWHPERHADGIPDDDPDIVLLRAFAAAAAAFDAGGAVAA